MLGLIAALLTMRLAVDAAPWGVFMLGDALGLGKVVAIVRDVAVLMDREEAAATHAPVAFVQAGASLEIDAGKLCNYPLGPQRNSIEVCRFIDSDTEWMVSEPDEAGRVRIADAAGARCVGYSALEARTSTSLKAVGCENGEYVTLFNIISMGAVEAHDIEDHGLELLPVEGTPPSDAFQQLYIGNLGSKPAGASGNWERQ